MLCCGYCFDSKYLQDHIKVHESTVGNCNICPTQQVGLIAPSKLVDLFSPLLDLYQRVENNGSSLIELLRADWGLFSGRSNEHGMKVLRLVLEDPNFEFDRFENRLKTESDEEYSWEDFKEELKHSNRYFPKSFPAHNELSQLLSFLSIHTDRNLVTLYRARINKQSGLYPVDSMGAPPSRLATAGRANPFGISYLYAASTENTAISELRPHKGDAITVAHFQLIGGLKLIDLRSPRATISPFRYSDDELKMIHSKLGLLEKLGEELTKPVSLDSAHLEYLSSQYICEFIKYKGYDGVMYKSSLGDGDNYAIFDTQKLKAVKALGYDVGAINIVFTENGEEIASEGHGVGTSDRLTGYVKWFNDKKGFGFITCESLECDVFVHHTSLSPLGKRASLKEGEEVEFSTEGSSKGMNALEVHLV